MCGHALGDDGEMERLCEHGVGHGRGAHTCDAVGPVHGGRCPASPAAKAVFPLDEMRRPEREAYLAACWEEARLRARAWKRRYTRLKEVHDATVRNIRIERVQLKALRDPPVVEMADWFFDPAFRLCEDGACMARPHYEDCPGCFGFGLRNGAVVSAGLAFAVRTHGAFREDVAPCPTCGSTIEGPS
jgi:hypothetical protein